MGFYISGNFFGKFKTGDNIAYNLKVLKVLYDLGKTNPKYYKLLIKPKVILIVAVIEAIFFDLYSRIRVNTKEGVRGMEDLALKLQNKKIKQYQEYVKYAKELNIFKTEEFFYTELEFLGKIRNRIHIQNMWNNEPKNENELFNAKLLGRAEISLERLVKVMSKNHYRRGEFRKYVEKLFFPWGEHLKPNDKLL